MPDFVFDTFTDTPGTLLQAHVGQLGATWTKHPSYATGSAKIAIDNQVVGTVNDTLYYASGTPPTPDYRVQSIWLPNDTAQHVGLAARMDTAANTGIVFQVVTATSTGFIQVFVAGTVVLDTSGPVSLPSNTPSIAELRVEGNRIRAYINEELVLQLTSASVTAAGKAAIFWSGIGGDFTGTHQLEFIAGPLPETSPRRALYPQYLTFAQYTPATATKLSSLTIWMLPKNIVLKDAAADEAWAYIITNTPTALQF